MMMRPTLPLAVLMAFAGCLAEPPTQQEQPAEPTFERQLLDVESEATDSIQVKQTTVPPQQLQHLTQAIYLRELRLDLTPITDAEADVIASLTSLEIVNLPASELTDKGVAQIATLPKLELLRIGSPHMTDAAIEKIGQSKTIRYLHLLNSPITDAAVPAIEKMEQLESFYADNTQLTDEGISELVKARPKLHIHFNDLHPADSHAGHSHDH